MPPSACTSCRCSASCARSSWNRTCARSAGVAGRHSRAINPTQMGDNRATPSRHYAALDMHSSSRPSPFRTCSAARSCSSNACRSRSSPSAASPPRRMARLAASSWRSYACSPAQHSNNRRSRCRPGSERWQYGRGAPAVGRSGVHGLGQHYFPLRARPTGPRSTSSGNIATPKTGNCLQVCNAHIDLALRAAPLAPFCK